jgi:hypothetical protein
MPSLEPWQLRVEKREEKNRKAREKSKGEKQEQKRSQQSMMPACTKQLSKSPPWLNTDWAGWQPRCLIVRKR